MAGAAQGAAPPPALVEAAVLAAPVAEMAVLHLQPGTPEMLAAAVPQVLRAAVVQHLGITLPVEPQGTEAQEVTRVPEGMGAQMVCAV